MDTIVFKKSFNNPKPQSNRMKLWIRLLVWISLGLFVFLLMDLVLHPHAPGDGPALANDHGVTFRYFATLAGGLNILVGLLVWRRVPGNLLGGLLVIWGASTAIWGIRSECATPEMNGLAYLVFYTFFYGIGWQSIIAFLYLYPSGHFYPPKNENAFVGLLFFQAILGLAANLANPTFGDPGNSRFIPNPVQISWLQSIKEPLFAINNYASLVVIFVPLATLVLRYRNGSHKERQQIKWLIWLAAVTAGMTSIIFLVWPYSEAIQNLPLVTQLFTFAFLVLFYIFPALACLIAIVRYRLWDIDIIIRKTLVYSVLTGLLGLVYFGGVALLQSILTMDRGLQPFSGGQASTVVIVLTTLAIAALFNPLRKRIQDFIDRRFYRQKYDADVALAEFAAAARSENDLRNLVERLVNVVQENLSPEKVVFMTSYLDKNQLSQDVNRKTES